MGLTFEPLGKYVRQVDERNTNMVTESVLGINIDKYFMPSVANVIGTDLSNYKLLRKGRFACNPMHVGRDGRLPVSRYTEDTPAIVSPAYFMFEIIDENEIEPEYLMLCFRRPDFDRMCWFRTDASVRGGITWDDVCALTIPVPSLPEQRKIVHDYQVITDRIELLRKMNENLEEQNLTLYKAYFERFEMSGGEMPSDWHRMTVGDVTSVTRGASPRPIQDFLCDNGMPWVKISDASASFSKYLFGTAECIIEDGVSKSRLVKPKTLIVSNSASPGLPMLMEIEACVHDGWLIIDRFKDVSQEFMYYFFINERQKIVLQSNGSVFNNLKTDIVKEQPIVVPDKKTMAMVTKHFQTVNNVVLNNALEAEALKRVRNHLLGTLLAKNAKGA